jgi:hypothetical protein
MKTLNITELVAQLAYLVLTRNLPPLAYAVERTLELG